MGGGELKGRALTHLLFTRSALLKQIQHRLLFLFADVCLLFVFVVVAFSVLSHHIATKSVL